MKLIFRVREYTRTIIGAPGYADYPNYWVYASNEFNDYYEALKSAIKLEKEGRYKNWVECLMDADPPSSYV